MNDKTNNVSFGLLEVSFCLELISEYHGATAVAKSALIEGRRVVRVGLCADHLLVNRALARADALTIRFLISLSLVEYCEFWSQSRDGASVRNGLKKLASIDPGDRAWGTQFASRLAIAEEMKVIDTLAIFGREPKEGPFTLFELELPQRTPSDITNWARNGPIEKPKPIPPKASRGVQPPAVVVQAPNPFFEIFHAAARGALDDATYMALRELAKTL